MPIPRNRRVRTAAVLAACVCLPGFGGCGGQEGPAEAPGAPIKVPGVSGTGRPVSEVHPELIKRIKDQCGGRMCVNAVVGFKKASGAAAPPEGSPPPADSPCAFQSTRPAPGQTVEQGGTIYMWASPPDVEAPEPRPCGVPPTVKAEPPDGDTGTPTGESPETDGSPAPTEDSPEPTGDVTPPQEDTGPGRPEDGDEVPEPGPAPDQEPT